MKCHVCNNETNNGETTKSSINKNEYFYCNNCLSNGYENYQDLIEFGWEYNMYNKTFKQKILLPTLNLNNKNIKQFNEDIINNLNEKENNKNK